MTHVKRSTRLQSSDPRWYMERSKRITASNFGLIMRRKTDINKTFMTNTFQKKEFSSSSTSYGEANEIIAKQMYIRNTGNHLHEDLPFLGATPNGMMWEKSTTAIIEIKCPCSVRDMSICEACETSNDFFPSKKWWFVFFKTQLCTLVPNPGSTSDIWGPFLWFYYIHQARHLCGTNLSPQAHYGCIGQKIVWVLHTSF